MRKFVQDLETTGLMSAAQVDTFLASLPEGQRPANAKALSRLLVCEGKLTKYQATAILRGKPSVLIFGDYVVHETSGTGGAGMVLKAEDRNTGGVVSLRLLPPNELDTPRKLARYESRVNTASRLTHPNIQHIIAAHESRTVHYLVTEFVDGRDLARTVRRNGPLSLGRALNYTIQAARGLAYAHSHGVVHGDIKPGNLLVDVTETVKIRNMGLSRRELEPDVPPTQWQPGELNFTSGEVATSGDVDERSDIYSLGCTLFFLLTGETPTPAGSVDEKIEWHQHAEIPLLGSHVADLPPAVEKIFARMVTRRPEDRYETVAALLADLEQEWEKLPAELQEQPMYAMSPVAQLPGGDSVDADDLELSQSGPDPVESSMDVPAAAGGQNRNGGDLRYAIEMLDVGEQHWKRIGKFGKQPCRLGRFEGDVTFPEIRTWARKHAEFGVDDQGHPFVQDLGSRNGIFRRIHRPVRLSDGQRFRVAEHLMEFRAVRASRRSSPLTESSDERFWSRDLELLGQVAMIRSDGSVPCLFPLIKSDVYIGRDPEACDIVLIDDLSSSRCHALIFSEEGNLWLQDNNSQNGTYVQIGERQVLELADMLLLGKIRIRIVPL